MENPFEEYRLLGLQERLMNLTPVEGNEMETLIIVYIAGVVILAFIAGICTDKPEKPGLILVVLAAITWPITIIFLIVASLIIAGHWLKTWWKERNNVD